MFDRLGKSARTRSAALLLKLNTRLDRILQFWLVGAGLAAMSRIALPTPHKVPVATFSTFLSYLLLVVAPFASTLLALRWFSDGHCQPQPATRLARAGRWIRALSGRSRKPSTLRDQRDHGLAPRRHDA